jgi:DNA-binding transcriptional ArsR family regulator
VELEQVLSSKPRLKILKLIYQLGQLNVSDLARRIKTSYTATAGHLKILENEGIVEARVYGRIHMYRLSESDRAKAVATLIDAWEKT